MWYINKNYQCISLVYEGQMTVGVAVAPDKKRWWRADVFVDLDIATVDSSIVSHCY